MNFLKDIFYKENDILIALIIIIVASFIIFTRINIILDYPAQVAQQITQQTEQSQEVDSEAN